MATGKTIRGKVYVLGDNIDTDQIIPAEYLNLVPGIPAEYRELGSHAMAGLPEGHRPFVEAGKETAEFSIIVAGRNFGCGSSREHAPVALAAAGVNAVIAESYARIFFRNVVSAGVFLPCECVERLCDTFETGDEIEIDVVSSSATRSVSGSTYELRPLGAVAPVVKAGGIFEYARHEGMI